VSALSLRPYQIDVIEACRQEIAHGRRRIILVCPTGGGKTVVAAKIVAGAAEKGKRGLFLVHRRELATQAARKLWEAGVDAGIVLPGFVPRPEQPIQVASIQSLTARAVRSATMPMPPADVVVVDEAHHALAPTYAALLEHFPHAVILGLSATPARADGRGLGHCFEVLVECPPTAELTRLKFLVPATVYAPAPPDLEGIKVRAGDYAENELAARMDDGQLIGDIVTHWLRYGQGRPTVAFAVNVAHSVHIRDEFGRAGIAAAHLDAKTPTAERESILSQLANGSLDVVTNCGVLCEGWDSPSVACLILARPTKSLGLYRQMAGRVLRPAPGKSDAIILDHAGSTLVHGFVDDDVAWSLSEDRRAQNQRHAARGAYRAPVLLDCPECGASRFGGEPCPACG
jgi:DNA repair protein RadD